MPNPEQTTEYTELSKKERISKLIDSCASKVKNIPIEIIEHQRMVYMDDNRSYEIIEQEILSVTKKILAEERLVNVDIDPNVLEKSIILIGPIGSGKSTVTRALCGKCNMPHISLDNREQLSFLYEQQHNFNNSKEFEFFLTANVLTQLEEPNIINFGAGHSIYENKAMFLEMQSLISRFKNVILLMPSDNKEESLAILNKRKGITSGSKQDFDNRHFVNVTCNYELATITIYTKDKTPDQISNEIIAQIKQNEHLSRKTV